MRAVPAASVSGELRVKDRTAADRELAELLTRVGGLESARRPEGSAVVVDVVIPRAGYGEFTRGLTAIGAWRPETESPDLPHRFVLTLRIRD
jgi:hypothetical protein